MKIKLAFQVGNASSNRNAGSTKWRLHWGWQRVKLELKMKQTWHLMSRSASTCLLIAHWEFLMYAWILCCDIDMIDHLDLGLRMLLFLYFIAILVWYIDMSIIIGYSPCFASYGDSVSSWLFYSLHMPRLTIVHCLTCCVVFSDWHIILIVFWAWCSYSYSSW